MKIPEKEYREYTVATSQAEAVWEEAPALKSDFALFRPHLEKLIGYNRRFIGYWGYEGTPYDTLLDYYEPGATVESVNKAFVPLRDAIVSLLKPDRPKRRESRTIRSLKKTSLPRSRSASAGISSSGSATTSKPAAWTSARIPFTIDNAGQGRHPHHHALPRKRVPQRAVFRLHPRGRPRDLRAGYPRLRSPATSLCHGVSMGIHESQSRFYEKHHRPQPRILDVLPARSQKALPPVQTACRWRRSTAASTP